MGLYLRAVEYHYLFDKTVLRVGPVLKKFHQNFCTNFVKASLKTWINPIYACIKKHNSKDPVATTNATEVPTTIINRRIHENQ